MLGFGFVTCDAITKRDSKAVYMHVYHNSQSFQLLEHVPSLSPS